MEDPFSCLISHCKPTVSQEEKLRKCPFARESEEHSDSLSSSPAPASPEPTAIAMVSLPDTDSVGQSDSLDKEVYQTPPEHGNSSSQPYLSGSEELRPASAAATLCSQSDSSWDKRASAADEDGKEHHGIVDLGTECDNLGFSEPPEVNCVGEGSDSGIKDPIHVGRGINFEESEFLNGDNNEYPSKRIRVLGEDLGVESPTMYVGETEPNAIKVQDDDSVNADMMGLESEEKIMADTVDSYVNAGDISVCENGSSIFEGKKSAADIEKHAPIDEKGKDDDVAKGEEERRAVGRRELPLSLKGGEKSVGGEEETGRRHSKNGSSSFKDIVKVLAVLLGTGDGDDGVEGAGLLETAQSRGWDFPKPRWWPPEGFDG
ncbi:unnamed protein product [Cuscuta campestris]|uniref:Uncharacterized protein n=1 Tax=Cuscuta campestris TaxID=132261 RepID=A0A484L2G9_9ASTE|nr:unnamed protein product [Cuscuta campestris]